MANIKVHIFVSGKVQGVGFRYFVKTNARRLSLTGWVRNLEDGRVEAVFSGDKKSIKTITNLCRKGPFMAQVNSVEIFKADNSEVSSDFLILPKHAY